MRKAECRTVALLLSAFCLLLSAFAAKAAPWTPHPSDGVEMHLTREGAVNRVDFDFHGHGGYAIARTRIDRDLPPNYQIVFRIRANAPPENLELKLLRGDDVWWLNRRDFVFPRDWTPIKTKKRQIAFAWGPSGGGEIKHVDSIEIVVTAGSGGKGAVWFSDPEFEELPVVSNEPLRFTTSRIDLGQVREIGGLVIKASGARAPSPARAGETPALHERVGDRTFVWMPDTTTRTIKIDGAVQEV